MGALLRDLGQLEEAERLGAEAVQGARRVLTTGHRLTAVYTLHYARTLAAMQRFDDADSLMLEAHAIFESSLGPGHDRTTGVIKHLADLYENWHEAAPGNGYDAKAAEWRAKLPDQDDTDTRDGEGDKDDAVEDGTASHAGDENSSP